MTRHTAIGRALAEIDAMDADERHARGIPVADAKRAVRRDVQVPGSIVYIESPLPAEKDIAVVVIVAGGGVQLRVALGRNRCANLISQLTASLV